MTLFFRAAPAGNEAFDFAGQGRFTLRLHDGVLDGEAVELGERDDAAVAATAHRQATSLAWRPGQAVAPMRDGKVAPGRAFSVQLDVEARVEERAMSVRDATQWSTPTLIQATNGAAQPMSLQADVLAGSCHVEVTRHLSFGRIRAADLADAVSTRVPSTRNGELRVTCDAPMRLAFRALRDERAGTAAIPTHAGRAELQSRWLGLGKTPAGENIGAYALRWAANASSEQGELHVTRSSDGGRSWSAAGESAAVEHGGEERLGYAAEPAATSGPDAVTTLGVTVDATIYIAPRETLSLNEDVTADGLVTFEIIY
jgi:hypothetical protein